MLYTRTLEVVHKEGGGCTYTKKLEFVHRKLEVEHKEVGGYLTRCAHCRVDLSE